MSFCNQRLTLISVWNIQHSTLADKLHYMADKLHEVVKCFQRIV